MIAIREGGEGDKAGVLELIAEVFGRRQADLTERLWHWQWHLDPRLPRPGYRAIVAEWRGRIIGNVSYIPAALCCRGRPLAASWGVNVTVHWGLLRQALRTGKTVQSDASTRPVLNRAQASLPDGLAAAMINHPATDPVQLGKHISRQLQTITARIGFRPVAESGNWTRQFPCLRTFRRVLGRRAAGSAANAVHRLAGRTPRSELEVGSLSGDFDARFDALWAQVKNEYSVIGRRDAETLNWRYRRHPQARYRVLTLEQGDQMRGYVVCCARQRGSAAHGQIVDIVTHRDDAAGREALLASALVHLRRAAPETVECYAAGPELAAALPAFGFAPKAKQHPVIVRGLAPRDLYVTESDGDGG